MNHLKEFYQHLKSNHYQKSTLEDYYYTLIRAEKYFKKRGLIDDKVISEKDIFNFMQ